MRYKAVKFFNPKVENDSGKYYPYPEYESTISVDDFVKEISHATSLTPSDVKAVVLELIEIFQRYLGRGHKVLLNGIGTFKISFKGVGEVTAEEVTAANIDRSTIRITFVADAALKRTMQAEISFSKKSEKADGANDKKDSATGTEQTE